MILCDGPIVKVGVLHPRTVSVMGVPKMNLSPIAFTCRLTLVSSPLFVLVRVNVAESLSCAEGLKAS